MMTLTVVDLTTGEVLGKLYGYDIAEMEAEADAIWGYNDITWIYEDVAECVGEYVNLAIFS